MDEEDFAFDNGYTITPPEGEPTTLGIRAIIHTSGMAIAIQGADQDDATAILDEIGSGYILIPDTNIVCLNYASFYSQ